jgi:hypothetical protein
MRAKSFMQSILRRPLPAEFEYFLNTSQWLDASGGKATRMMSKLVAAVRLAIERSANLAPVLPATSAAVTAALASGATLGGARLRRRTAIVAGFLPRKQPCPELRQSQRNPSQFFRSSI